MQVFDPHHSSILIDEKAIQNRVRELGSEISEQYPDGVILVGILTGALYFLVDLSREISCPIEIDLIAISSYVGTSSSGTVTFTKDLSREMKTALCSLSKILSIPGARSLHFSHY